MHNKHDKYICHYFNFTQMNNAGKVSKYPQVLKHKCYILFNFTDNLAKTKHMKKK